MDGWKLTAHELKRYPHFDPFISADAAIEYATNKEKVAHHNFYPFMRFVQRWTRYAPKGQLGKQKKRELRYAARRDAYIFAYYRWQLSALYENALKENEIDGCVLAYRRIVDNEHIAASWITMEKVESATFTTRAMLLKRLHHMKVLCNCAGHQQFL